MQKLILLILVLIVFVISVFSYIQYARNNRIWPFNSGLTRFLPEGTKQLAYKITNPKLIETLRSIQSIFYQSILSGPQKSINNSSKLSIDDNKNDIETAMNNIIKLNKYNFPVIANKNNIGEYSAKDNNDSGRINTGASANIIVDKEKIGTFCSNDYNNVGDRITTDVNNQLKHNPFVIQLLTKFDN